MTSQGQRFRRRALRRGYKVDEVDSFLDRVEATIAGDPIGSAVSAQEVHDVVFRVRFGGYDEWQVDLHLDRVERQLSELEERGGGLIRGMDSRPGDARPRPPERMAPQMDRMPPMPDRMGAPTIQVPPVPAGPPGPPQRPPVGVPAGLTPHEPPPFGRYEDAPFDGFEAGRHGRDMTAEIRMPADTGYGSPAGYGGPPSGFGGPPSGFGGPPSGFGGPPPGYGGPSMPGPGGPVPGALTGEAARIEQLRHSFQPRRFGSGYDRAQVDRFFEGVVAALSGRSPMSISEAQLNPAQFELVPGGYYEAEVNAALNEVRDVLSRRR